MLMFFFFSFTSREFYLVSELRHGRRRYVFVQFFRSTMCYRQDFLPAISRQRQRRGRAWYCFFFFFFLSLGFRLAGIVTASATDHPFRQAGS